MSIELVSRTYVELGPPDGAVFYEVEYIADGYPFSHPVPIKDGDTDQKALAWLNANAARVTYAAKVHYDKSTPLLERMDSLQNKVATLEAAVDALEAKP